MRLLISDANILIDVEIGGLVAPMFSLDYRFFVPDVLFYEELDEQHGYLIDMGLEVRELDERMVARVFDLAGQYKRPGRYDLFALVLAAEENCPLLTGDKDLKAAAESENVEVRGTLWLVEEMVRPAKSRCRLRAMPISECRSTAGDCPGRKRKIDWHYWISSRPRAKQPEPDSELTDHSLRSKAAMMQSSAASAET